jgi:uncharacterized repeat protein (TIGR01451 family)
VQADRSLACSGTVSIRVVVLVVVRIRPGLFEVDKISGALTPIGYIGAPEVIGLSFRPSDGSAWAWGDDVGLFSVDLNTGHGTLVFGYSASVEAMSWNAQGTLLYLGSGSQLSAYNPITRRVSTISKNLPSSVEALEMRPDGLLAVGVHTGTTIYAYDPIAKKTVSAENLSVKPYDDIEGIGWQHCPYLRFTKTADAASVEAGNPIGFTLKVTNRSPNTAAITVNDPLPGAPDVAWSISPAVSGCEVVDGTLICSFASVAPWASVSVHVTASPTTSQCGVYTNTATAGSDQTDTVTSSAVTKVVCPPPPGTVDFWRDWRKRYTSTQEQLLVDYIKVNNPKVFNKSGYPLTIAKVDAILKYGTSPTSNQKLLGELTAFEHNLATTALDGTGGLVQYNPNVCTAGLVDVTAIGGATAFFGTSTPTIHQIIAAIENRWTGKLTTKKTDWKWNLNEAQKTTLITVLSAINSGTIAVTGCS